MSRTARSAPRVAEAMVTIPRTWPEDLTLADAHDAFTDPKIHLLLLTRAGRLVTTVLRSDLPARGPERADEQARRFGSCAGRVTAPHVLLDEAEAWMRAAGQRRLAVIGPDDQVLGLLCAKASGSGYCSDDDVRSRQGDRTSRSTVGPG